MEVELLLAIQYILYLSIVFNDVFCFAPGITHKRKFGFPTTVSVIKPVYVVSPVFTTKLYMVSYMTKLYRYINVIV